MVKKLLYTLELIILAVIFFVSGQLLSVPNQPLSEELQLLKMQEEYSLKVKKDLENTLETLVGPGNVKVFVQIYLKKAQTNIQTQKGTAYNKTIETKHTQAVVVDQQHVSLILNNTPPVKLATYKNLTESALGINKNLGDTLAIEILPFYKHPFFTFGLSRLTLIKLAGVMLGVFFILCILLIYIYLKERDTFTQNDFLSGKE